MSGSNKAICFSVKSSPNQWPNTSQSTKESLMFGSEKLYIIKILETCRAISMKRQITSRASKSQHLSAMLIQWLESNTTCPKQTSISIQGPSIYLSSPKENSKCLEAKTYIRTHAHMERERRETGSHKKLRSHIHWVP